MIFFRGGMKGGSRTWLAYCGYWASIHTQDPCIFFLLNGPADQPQGFLGPIPGYSPIGPHNGPPTGGPPAVCRLA